MCHPFARDGARCYNRVGSGEFPLSPHGRGFGGDRVICSGQLWRFSALWWACAPLIGCATGVLPASFGQAGGFHHDAGTLGGRGSDPPRGRDPLVRRAEAAPERLASRCGSGHSQAGPSPHRPRMPPIRRTAGRPNRNLCLQFYTRGHGSREPNGAFRPGRSGCRGSRWCN